MLTAEETSVGREWGWVWGPEYDVFRAVDHGGLTACCRTPEDEHDALPLTIQFCDHAVGEVLPTTTSMTVGRTSTNAQHRI